MASDKHALVIDNGSDTIKAGFSCKNQPQVIIPSLVGQPRPKFLNHITFNPNLKDRYVGNEAQVNRDILELSHPIENGLIKQWDDMEKLWHFTFDKLDASPKEQAILLTDTPNNPRANRERMAEIMFESFKCPAIYLSIQGVLSLHSYGLVTGVAVDLGADVTQIAPIIDGYIIPCTTRCVPLGGRDLTLCLLKLLAGNGIAFSAKHCVQYARRIKEKLCYVATDFEKEIKVTNTPRLRRTHTLPDGRKVTLGNEQFCCPEVLFQPDVLGRNFNGIHRMCCDSIVKSKQSSEITKSLFSNIVFSGGSSMFPGLASRFLQEVQLLAPSHVQPNVLIVEDRQNNAWIGGSIVTSLPTFQEMWLTREEYDEKGPPIIHKTCI